MSTQRKRRRVCRLLEESSQSLLLQQCRQAQSNKQLLRIVQNAAQHECDILRKTFTSPTVQAIIIAGATSTRKNGVKVEQEELVLRIISVCSLRGIDPTCGLEVTGTKWELPIVAAAHHGMVEAVKLLLKCGAKPDSCNSDGLTCWHAAFSNPSSSTGSTIRDCDAAVAQLLIDEGIIVQSKRQWECNSELGTHIYVAVEDNCYLTVLASSIYRKNFRAAEIAVRAGAKLSDMDFCRLYMDRKARREQTKLVPIVLHVSNVLGHRHSRTGSAFDKLSACVWDSAIDWSFPPKWRRCACEIDLCLGFIRGMPRLVVWTVLQFCGRDWFMNLALERRRQHLIMFGGGQLCGRVGRNRDINCRSQSNHEITASIRIREPLLAKVQPFMTRLS